MGGRTRYQPYNDYAHEAEHKDEVMRRGGPPQSLSDAEIEGGEVPVTRSPEPIAVSARVRFAGTSIQVDAFKSTWTTRAVEVVWRTPKGDTRRAWVWANAVRRRDPTNEE